MRNLKKSWWAIFALFFVAVACKKDDDNPDPVEVAESKGFYIINEGIFSQGNASLSFYDYEKDSMYNDLFYSINSRPLGDVFQNLVFNQGKAYLVMNYSNKIEVADSASMKSITTVTGLTAPNAIFFYGSKAYITDMYSGKIGVYNAASMTKLSDIEVGGSTDQILAHNGKLVVNIQQSSGYAGDVRKGILVINPDADTVEKYVELKEGASQLLIDINNKLWVYCAGHWDGPVNGAIYRLNLSDYSIEKEFPLGVSTYSAVPMVMNKAKTEIYYILPDLSGGVNENDVFKIPVTASALSTSPVYNGADKWLYGFNVDEERGELLLLDAVDGAQKGNFIRADLNTGKDIASYEVGYFPKNAIIKR